MNTEIKNTLTQILSEFAIEGEISQIKPLTEGHINTACMTELEDGRKLTVQKVNTGIFKDPKLLMDNIVAVTEHVRAALKESGCDEKRGALNFHKAKNGEFFILCDGCWRVYDYIDGVHTISSAGKPADFQKAGEGFGRFQNLLSDFDGSRLGETIPDFHNTPKRLEALKEAIKNDRFGRVKDVKEEIAFALSRKEAASEAIRLIESGALPVRVTHNDTKINNILIDDLSNEPVCVIDLDTVMPGLIMNDFGDAIRSGASTASEEEKDLSKVEIDLELFEAFARGFIGECGSILTDEEKKTLPLGAKLMSFECGVRFLTDHLEGDTYFRVSYPGENLDRARNQFRLVEDIEGKLQRMNEIVRSF